MAARFLGTQHTFLLRCVLASVHVCRVGYEIAFHESDTFHYEESSFMGRDVQHCSQPSYDTRNSTALGTRLNFYDILLQFLG